MTEILIGYGTTEGQTARIAKYIADVIQAQGHEAQVLDLKRSKDVPLDGTDAVIIGGSIHMGKHEESVGDFVRKNRGALERLPSAFFSVSLAARGDMENARAYVENFEQETGWRPAQVGYFGVPALPPVRTHQTLDDEEDRPRQARQPQSRYVTRPRVHRMGRCEAVRRGLPETTRFRKHSQDQELEAS